MEISLISLIEDISCISLRYPSSYIRIKGHKTKLIFLPRRYSEGWEEYESYRYPYNIKTLKELTQLCSQSEIIGVSLGLENSKKRCLQKIII